MIDISTGKKIGTHKGIWFYTIGQRKGLGMSGGPWFVVKKNVRDNVIYVSNGYDTRMQYGREIPLEEINWITMSPFDDTDAPFIEISFKTRHTPEFTSGRLVREGDKGMKIIADSDVQGIAPGQFAIIYTPDHELCLGSGMITASTRKKRSRKTGRDSSSVSSTVNP